MTPKRLWAPWRLAYIAGGKIRLQKRCLFCQKKNGGSLRERILIRGKTSYCVLNKYPYNNGHLLIVPYRHVGRLENLREEEWLELFHLTREAIARLKKVMHPHGFNIGVNVGRAAGAGVPGHLHLHLVPRWWGDTNFMPALSDTRVISQSLKSAHRFLKLAGDRSVKKTRRLSSNA